MTNLDYFRNVLSNEFISNDTFLEEPKENMRIDLIKTGCNSFIFIFDKQLGRDYKGGMFPFFNKGEKGVCKVCDYIIFAEKSGKCFSLVIELKKGKEGTNPQLKAGVCFVDYVKSTVNRVYNKDLEIVVRKVSIKEFRRKNRTKLKEIEYNEHNIHEFSDNRLRLQAFLK